MRESVAVQYSHHATLSQRLAALRFPVFNPFFPMRRALSRAIGEAALGAGGRVLDVGCGAKPYEHFFTSCTSYFGVDIEVSGHDHATSKIDAFFDGVHLPFADRSIDCVCAFEVFEHVFELDLLLEEIQRVVKPDGQLLISIPFLWPEHEPPYDFARYTSWGIQSLLKKHSFEIVKSTKTSGGILVLGQLLSQSIHMAGRTHSRLVQTFLQVTLIFPINMFATVLDSAFKRREEMFLGQVITAQLKI